jgi:hypothetical protein
MNCFAVSCLTLGLTFSTHPLCLEPHHQHIEPCLIRDSNPEPLGFKSEILPTEPWRLANFEWINDKFIKDPYNHWGSTEFWGLILRKTFNGSYHRKNYKLLVQNSKKWNVRHEILSINIVFWVLAQDRWEMIILTFIYSSSQKLPPECWPRKMVAIWSRSYLYKKQNVNPPTLITRFPLSHYQIEKFLHTNQIQKIIILSGWFSI